MHRREAVQYIGLLLGGTMVGAGAILSGCKANDKKSAAGEWSAEDIAYLDEVADTILPTTAASPGAKAAQVGQFMTVMVNDCYTERDQKIFREGMDKLNDAADKKYNTSFMKLSPQQRTEFLNALDKEATAYAQDQQAKAAAEQKEKKDDDEGPEPHYFRMMKELTLLGYFTSQVGTTQARRHVPVPGRFEGCIPYKKGDKAFA